MKGANPGRFPPVFINVQTGLLEILLRTEYRGAKKGSPIVLAIAGYCAKLGDPSIRKTLEKTEQV